MGRVTQAVILAAGLGTRLESVTKNQIPKVMVPLAGKPVLEWQIERLHDFGFEQIFINLHFLPHAVRNYFGDGSKWGVRIEYNLEKPRILGTAGGIKGFERKLNEDFMVCYGDNFSLIDYSKFIDAYFRQPNVAAVTLIGDNQHPEDSDLAETDKDLRIVKIYPKPHKSFPAKFKTMKAMHIFSKEVLNYIPPQKYYEIDRQLLPALLKKNKKIYGYESQEYIEDIGTPERYQKALQYIKHNAQLK
jgi:mannose-1-phosphate guanylyltransferase/phosphomannomutase